MVSSPSGPGQGKDASVQGLDISECGRGKIDASVAELIEERDAVKDLGLI